MPPAPSFLFVAPASYAPFPWIDETGDDRYRRAVYTWRRRTTPHPAMQAFDVPEGSVSCVRRMRSNTPLQALVTLNEPVSMEAAQGLARRMLSEGGADDSSRIEHGFRLCLSRHPENEERAELERLLKQQLERINDPAIKPEEIALSPAKGLDALPPDTDAKQLAAYTIVARVLLNLDETITKE